MRLKVVGLSASLRNARRGGGNHQLVAELLAQPSKDELVNYLKQQASIHLSQFVEAGRSQMLPFDELYKNLKKLKGDRGLSNSEIVLAAALWSAAQLGADIEHHSLSEFFPENGKAKDLDKLKEALLSADGLLLSSPVYFGDRGSLSQSFTDWLRQDSEVLRAVRGKVYGGLAVGAKRNGGQETTLIYQLLDMVQCGYLGVGNDSETTSQYGGTGWAGDIGAMPKDDYGLDTSMGTGRRVTRVAAILQMAQGHTLADRPKVAFWILQDKDNRARRYVEKLVESGRFAIEPHIHFLADKKIVRCLACDVCPTNVDLDNVYRCIIKSKSDAFPGMHEQLIDVDAIVPVTYCSTQRDGMMSQYQKFIERTRYLRRGDYIFSDILCAPLVLEDLGTFENMQIRMLTSMLRHHTIILKPITGYLRQGALLNEDQVLAELDEVVAQARRTTAGRLVTYASKVEHLKYNPVGYVLSAMKDEEDQKMQRRRDMIESRMEHARRMVALRLLPDATQPPHRASA
ncbi:MAG: NAD(P)H-dependent oxidoreductase [Gemmataceae bacterium]|nr:NAD(P)H-dependent oxidoreductase [Gemmataceae bacterium]MCI0742922.1 NAD(P)H-dependent oxidoreductase [Gemmataceae bacterium]